jgi:glycosyltransferase involved in cell wall biosynthesis
MRESVNADSAILSIIIPAYNEENKIAGQIEYLEKCSRSYPTEIIVVDGCSTDQTAEKVRERGFT